jgi:hypothetical protein
MDKSSESEINIKQLSGVLTHMINNNKQLQAVGQVPVAMNVVGPAGLGKTSIIKQVGKAMGYQKENIVMLNLSTFEEIGDLIGIPLTEYRMSKENKVKEGEKKTFSAMWVKEQAIPSFKELGFNVTNQSRMSYAPPEWIAGIKGPGLLILDDYTRASQRFTQAVMQLIEDQSYATWELPEGWTILLSSNPDDGTYNVTDQDPAQKSRYMNVHLKFNAEIWAEWAEQHKIDSRCINFVLMNKEIVKPETPHVNARSITKFFNSISSIKDFNTPESLELIQLLGEGSLGVEVTTMFTAFIHNEMDKLITTEEILDTTVSFKTVDKRLKDLVKGKKNDYRGDIAYVICSRLITHCQFNLNEDNTTDAIIDRIEELLGSDSLGTDLKFVLGKKITNLDVSAFNRLLTSDAVLDNILD